MAALGRVCQGACRLQLQCLKLNTRHLSTLSSTKYASTGAHWNQDWLPGERPTTKEEHDAAAKKYGLLPEDYKPFPPGQWVDYGDYPDLPVVAVIERDPNEVYDDVTFRRAYMETPHVDLDMYLAERASPHVNNRDTPFWVQVRTFLSFVVPVIAFAIFAWHYPDVKGLAKKQYVADLKDGEKHYTFVRND